MDPDLQCSPYALGARRSMRERPKTSAKPTPLAEALQAWIKRKGLVKRMDQAVVLGEWAELVGPQIIGRLNTGRPGRPITGIRWVVGALGPDGTL